MQGRNFLDKLATLAPEVTEYQAVCRYKQNSHLYQNAEKAALQTDAQQSQKQKDAMRALAKATTFAEMINIVNEFDVEKEPIVPRLAFKTVLSIGSFFSAEANLSHYIFQLKNDIIQSAKQKGYYNLESLEDPASFKMN